MQCQCPGKLAEIIVDLDMEQDWCVPGTSMSSMDRCFLDGRWSVSRTLNPKPYADPRHSDVEEYICTWPRLLNTTSLAEDKP